MNFSRSLAKVEGNAATVKLPGGGTAQVGVGFMPAGGGAEKLDLGVRPEHCCLVEASDASAALSGRISIVEHLGNVTLLDVERRQGRRSSRPREARPPRVAIWSASG